MAYDSTHSQVVLFGGQGPTTQQDVDNLILGVLNDTWVWDGTNWTQKVPQTSPAARVGHAMAYHAAKGQVVMHGGYINGPVGYADDTWVWNGSNWIEQFGSTYPGLRAGAAMAYDSAHAQVVLFGGTGALTESGSSFLGDTWLWDGSQWTQASPQTSPGPRAGHGMAYDSVRGQVVLFGGNGLQNIQGPCCTTLNDTWVWDGSNWTQESPKTSPPVRSEFAMAFDAAQSRVVMFGGQGAVGVYVEGDLNDTWLWDGSNWTQASPQTSPPVRDLHAMAHDSTHQQIVLFAGELSFGPGRGLLNDTWTWSGALLPTGPSIRGVVSASEFGGFPSVAPGSWVEIYGSNLAPDARPWAGTDFDGDNAPTSLDGVGVTIGNQKAFVDYISAGQVNAQLPSTIATGGKLELTVTNGSETSSSFSLTVNPTQPGLLAPLQFKIGANQYVVALHSDGSYVLPSGAIAGVNSSPAQPGEEIVMYALDSDPSLPTSPPV